VTQRKPWITTLALVGVAALLAAYIFLVEAKREPPPEEGVMPTPAPLWEFEGGDLVEITVTRREQTAAVERSGDSWRMTAPEAVQVEGDSLVYLITLTDVDGLLRLIDEPPYPPTPTPPPSPVATPTS